MTMLQTWIEICKRREDETGLEWRVRVCVVRSSIAHPIGATPAAAGSALGTRSEDACAGCAC